MLAFPSRTLQLVMYARDTATGGLSALSVSANVGDIASVVHGNVAGFVLSEVNSQVVLGMSNDDDGALGGVVVLDITVRMMKDEPC